MKPLQILKLLRVQQWAKNLFVFLPLFFSGQMMNPHLLLQSVVAFFAFSFAASSIYCFNDIYDVQADRAHPQKSGRPIASGAVSLAGGYVLMAVCLALSVSAVCLFAGAACYGLLAVLAVYYAMNIAYCIALKRYAIVDVMTIAAGFVLRVLAGGIATGIELTEWVILMTFLLALFLAFAKRRDDVILYRDSGVAPRKNTSRYNMEFINQVMTLLSTVTVVAYIMYTVSPDVTARFGSDHIYLTSFFVLAGILRYLQVSIVDNKSGSPTKILLRDRFIHACILGWILAFMVIIYL